MQPGRALPAIVTLAAVIGFPAAAGAANVRTDRPRMFLSNGSGPGTSLASFKQRCTSDPAYSQRCQGALSSADNGGWPAWAHAAAYIVNGDATQCTAAVTALQAAGANDTPG